MFTIFSKIFYKINKTYVIFIIIYKSNLICLWAQETIVPLIKITKNHDLIRNYANYLKDQLNLFNQIIIEIILFQNHWIKFLNIINFIILVLQSNILYFAIILFIINFVNFLTFSFILNFIFCCIKINLIYF